MIFALIGNQNCGKTTLFNQITGANQHVGNFPGVTVDQTMGSIRGQEKCSVVDLPGIYSIRPYSAEEIITRDFLLNSKPDGIINIVDATNIERNLYLTLQLLELHIPTVIALNMMDEMRENGGSVDVEKLSETLGVDIVPISALKNEGVDELIKAAVSTVKKRRLPAVTDFCSTGPIHRAIHSIAHQIEDHAENNGISPRFAATKVIEGDEDIIRRLDLTENELDGIEHSIVEMEEEYGLDRHAAMAEMRYTFIERVCGASVIKAAESKERKRSVKIDRILTNKYLSIPIFIGAMLLIFWLTFDVVGDTLSGLLEQGIGALTNQSDCQQPCNRRYFYRRGQCADLSALYCHAVFLPVYSGGFRIYGEDCLCNGQDIEKDRSFGTQYCPAPDRLRLYGACRYGDEDAVIQERPALYGHADTVYELQRENTDLYCICRSFFRR